MKSIFMTIICLTIVNVGVASDSVIWRQELGCDPNSTYRPSAMLVDSKNNELIVLGTSNSSAVKEVDIQLWRIDPNGGVTQKKSLELLSEFGSFVAKTGHTKRRSCIGGAAELRRVPGGLFCLCQAGSDSGATELSARGPGTGVSTE